MRLLTPTTRALRSLPNLSRTTRTNQCLRIPSALPRPSRHVVRNPIRALSTTRTLLTTLDAESHTLAEKADLERRAYHKRRMIYSGLGFVAGMIGIWVLAHSIDLPPPAAKLESRPDDPLVNLGKERKVVVQKLGEEPEENIDVVETGTSTVPTFPRLLEFVDVRSGDADGMTAEGGVAEYTLLGLGIRTVSFLGIQVYVVGMYVATDDIAALQSRLIRTVAPAATSLVAGEKEDLRAQLLDAEKSEQIWSDVLRAGGIRTLFRVVPVRDTDFGHMRDAYVRAVTSQARKNPDEFGDEDFGASVNQLKAMFGTGSLKKRKELLLARDARGELVAWFDDGKGGPTRLGSVRDERIGRALWLHYLAGKHVASEPARRSIVDGIMEYVERPVGTVASMVHV